MTRTYGTIQFHQKPQSFRTGEGTVYETEYLYQGTAGKGPHFMITGAEPHVCIKLKGIFEHLRKGDIDDFAFPFIDEMCHNLLWFLDRYPMQADKKTMQKLKLGQRKYLAKVKEMENILSDVYSLPSPAIKEPYQPRHYQLQGATLWLRQKKPFILADDMGLGKSLSALLAFVIEPKILAGVIVCETHLTTQWKRDMVEKFTNLTAYIIPVGKIHKLPPADLYIIPYSRIAKWVDVLAAKIKTIVFDEVQQLRVGDEDSINWTDKYRACRNLAKIASHVIGLSGTPIYNYGIEIFNILDCMSPGCLGDRRDFTREYGYKIIKDAKGLGSYLRERYLMLRRTTHDVRRELPQLNTIITEVEWNKKEVAEAEEIAVQLAQSFLTASSFSERGKDAMEFNMKLRQITGIGKAHGVAAMVKILLENDYPVMLTGWHRDVYDIWLKELWQYDPVLYTGSESPAQKDEAVRKFTSGESKVFIISNRSGAGLDGLQYVCKDIVIGELDWSPKVHDQLITRLLRDGQKESVNVYYPLVEEGSDPVLVDILAIKKEQAHMIVDPMMEMPQQHTDDSRIKILAENYLTRKGIALPLQLEIDKKGELKNKKIPPENEKTPDKNS